MGSVDYPLTARVASDIETHGLKWAIQYHWRRWGKKDRRSFRLIFCVAYRAI